MFKNIILFGFRYTGKSTIGKAIAEINGLTFIDVDDEIEKQEKKSIHDITHNGKKWEKFRTLEYEMLQKWIDEKDVVISCGGGMGVNEFFGEKERDILSQSHESLKILLEISEETIQKRVEQSHKRVEQSHKRPNVNKLDPIALYRERKPLYNLMNYDIKIDSSHKHTALALQNKKLSCVAGFPIEHSLSPHLHNSCYKDLKIDDTHVFTKIEICPKNFHKIKNIIRTLNLKGISITSPYKEEIMQYCDNIDTFAKKIGAVNTVVHEKNALTGYNTDCIGIIKALEKNTEIQNKRVAIFGSGGAAKSAVIALLSHTKHICLFNRTKDKNKEFAKKNSIDYDGLEAFQPNNFDIIINATTVGLNEEKSILNAGQILDTHTVFDMVYSPHETQLLQIASQKGAQKVYGIEMLIFQAMEQFKLYTNQIPNEHTMRNAVQKKHSKKCIVVMGKTIKEFLENLKKAQKLHHFVELRADYIENIHKKDIDKIAKTLKVNAIFTCRMSKDGGSFTGSKKENKDLIQYAISLNKFSHFDIDLTNAKEYEDLYTKRQNWQLILSYHNFETSGDETQYSEILKQMETFRPDITKIAVTIKNNTDIISMIKIFDIYKTTPLIFAPMSESKTLRMLAYEKGSWTNFLTLNEQSITAPGQILFQDFKKIKKLFENK